VLERELGDALRAQAMRVASTLDAKTLFTTVSPMARGRRALRERLPATPQLADDIASAVELLADLTEVTDVGLRLARLQTAMCPRLHVDRVTLRLVLTYVGAGTEYVDGATFDRTLLGKDMAHAAAAREGTIPIVQARAGDIVLLKGEAWPGNVGKGAVHRSPAASPERPRLVLTLDAL